VREDLFVQEEIPGRCSGQKKRLLFFRRRFYSLMKTLVLTSHFYIKAFQSFTENLEEVFDILYVYGTEGTEAEGIRRRNLARINGKTAVVAVVMHLFEIPVRVFGGLDRNDEARFNGRVDDGIEAEFSHTLADCFVNAAVAGEFCGFTFGKVFLERLGQRHRTGHQQDLPRQGF